MEEAKKMNKELKVRLERLAYEDAYVMESSTFIDGLITIDDAIKVFNSLPVAEAEPVLTVSRGSEGDYVYSLKKPVAEEEGVDPQRVVNFVMSLACHFSNVTGASNLFVSVLNEFPELLEYKAQLDVDKFKHLWTNSPQPLTVEEVDEIIEECRNTRASCVRYVETETAVRQVTDRIKSRLNNSTEGALPDRAEAKG